MPIEEIRRISEFARMKGILMHLDGARLWEAVAAGAGSLHEFCALFDTVTLCFSKGLGAPIGSILVGRQEKIKHARWVRKSIGGGLRQVGVLAAPARVAVEETFGGGLLKQSHLKAKRIEKMWTNLGGKVQYPVETNMCWLDLNSSGVSAERLIKLGQQAGLKLAGGRLVVNYQTSEDAIQKLGNIFVQVLERSSERLLVI